MFCHFWQKFENSKWPPFLGRGKFFKITTSTMLRYPVGRFVYLGFLRRFQHCTGHITTGSWKGRGNQYIEFARVVYCKLPTNGKQLPAFPLTAMTGIEPRPQRWEARVLPRCHRGPDTVWNTKCDDDRRHRRHKIG